MAANQVQTSIHFTIWQGGRRQDIYKGCGDGLFDKMHDFQVHREMCAVHKSRCQ